MIAGGHDHFKGRFFVGAMFVHGFQHLGEEDLICYAPDSFLKNFFPGNRHPVLDLIAVCAKKAVHVIKVAVTAVDKITAVALLIKSFQKMCLFCGWAIRSTILYFSINILVYEI